MSQQDFTTALARLLSDSGLRREFEKNPTAVADQLLESAYDKQTLLAISPAQLNSQADGLLQKRANQIANFLPQTWQLLAETARPKFLTYASENPWPEGHRRHLLDATSFGEWLSDRSDPGLVRCELHRCRFALSPSRMKLHINRSGVCFFWRSGKRIRSHRLGLPF